MPPVRVGVPIKEAMRDLVEPRAACRYSDLGQVSFIIPRAWAVVAIAETIAPGVSCRSRPDAAVDRVFRLTRHGHSVFFAFSDDDAAMAGAQRHEPLPAKMTLWNGPSSPYGFWRSP